MAIIKDKQPHTIQTSILIRALGEAGFKDVYEQYCNTRSRSRFPSKPTQSQLRLASMAKDFGYTLAAKKASVAPEVVYAAVNRVSKYYYLFPEGAEK